MGNVVVVLFGFFCSFLILYSFFGQQQLTFLHHQICSTCPSFAAVLHSARIENRVIDERTLTIEKENEKMGKDERQGRQAE